MFLGIVVLVIGVVSANDYVETTGICQPQDGSYVGLGDFGMTLDQCRSWCDAVPSCTGFHYSNLKGPQHSTWSHRCMPFQASRGCNQQEQEAPVQRYRDAKLDCCLDMSCPNNQYLSGAVGASKYNWICMNTWNSRPSPPFFEYNQELNLDGVSDRVDVSNDFNTIQGGEMTFAFRATQKSIDRNYERAWDWSGSCGQASHVFADVYTSLRMTFQVYGLGTLIVDNFWELGVEHVYAFVVSSTHMKVYRDGNEMGALAVNGGISNSVRDQFYIGGSSCDCEQAVCGSMVHRWHANVNWFRVWTEALTETRIRDLNTLRRTQTPTVQPTALPTLNPTSNPSLNPTSNPSLNPSSNPSLSPSSNPSLNPSSSPTLTPTTNPSKRPTAEDFIVKVKAFHGEPKDVLDSSKLQDQPEVDAEFFGFEHRLTPLTRRLLNRFYDVQEQGFGREDDLESEEQLQQLVSETTAKDLAMKKNENLPIF